MAHRAFLRSVATLAAVVLAACSSPPAAEAPAPGGGGGGGEPGCADLSAERDCRDPAQGACATTEVCTIDPGRSCKAARCCTLGVECREKQGETAGGYRCEQDEECQSGLCLTTGGVGVCFRACSPGAANLRCKEGFACTLVPVTASASVYSCLGEEGGALASDRTLCRSDADCLEGRYCRIFDGAELNGSGAYAVCVPGARSGEVGRPCQAVDPIPPLPPEGTEHLSDFCTETGLCYSSCTKTGPEICGCVAGAPEGLCRTTRCMPPCAKDEDCPAPLVCRPMQLLSGTFPDPDFKFLSCSFPIIELTAWGCYDETDCCSDSHQRGGHLCCERAVESDCPLPVPETTHCRAEVGASHYTSRCGLPLGLAALGAPCSAAEECESALCSPEGSCTSPCMVGIGDRCAELLPGSSCCGTRVGGACVPECRTDCGAGPTCG